MNNKTKNELYRHGLGFKCKYQPFDTGSHLITQNSALSSNYVFIDWLTMSQKHPCHTEFLPVVNGSVVVKYDEDGEIVFESIGFKEHKGSFESHINIKCDGINVSVSGNPSRYNKIDNVFGLQSTVDAVSVYNNILKIFGLPPFEKNKATFSRIDITQNYSAGKGNELQHIRCLSSATYRGKTGFLYPNGQTCDWFQNSTRLYLKVYNKYYELKKHYKKLIKTGKLEPQQEDYLSRLIKETENAGIVRVELGVRSAVLKDCGLRVYKGEIMGELIQLFQNKNPYNEKSKYFFDNNSDDIFELALAKGFSEIQSQNIRNHYEQWLNGVDLSARYKKSQYYLIRKNLKICGIDVSSPMDVSKLQYVMKPLSSVPLLPSDEYLGYEQSVRRLSYS